jgi:hypothetical protein
MYKVGAKNDRVSFTQKRRFDRKLTRGYGFWKNMSFQCGKVASNCERVFPLGSASCHLVENSLSENSLSGSCEEIGRRIKVATVPEMVQPLDCKREPFTRSSTARIDRSFPTDFAHRRCRKAN